MPSPSLTDALERETSDPSVQDLDELLVGPLYRVFNLPSNHRTRCCPVLAVRLKDGSSILPLQTAIWARFCQRNEMGGAQIRKRLHAVGRFYEYWTRCMDGLPFDTETLTMAAFCYIGFRLGERSEDDLDSRALAPWRPISFNTARAEWRYLADYFHYCRDTFGTAPLGNLSTNASDNIYKSLIAMASETKRNVLAHLRPHRQRWRGILGLPPAMPRLAPWSDDHRARGSDAATMPKEEVDAIVDAEQNIVFKALWIELAYGGVRISEALNHWLIDVMPSHLAPWFGSPHLSVPRVPFVLLAHPSKSSFTGQLGLERETRAEFLARRYGLTGRNLLDPKDPLYAGWKGMAYLKDWENVVFWIDQSKAREFFDLVVEIRELHRVHSIAGRHPYLYINAAHKRFLGAPLRYSNVADAFDRACHRVGLKPHRSRRSLHGFRHFYKSYAQNELGLEREYVQMLLRHRSLESQNDYGRDALKANWALMNAFNKREEACHL